MELAAPQLADKIRAAKPALVQAWYEHQFSPSWVANWQISGVREGDRERLTERFLAPLVELLCRCLGGDQTMSAIYLDERLRYAPHREAMSRRAEFFQQLLNQDLASLRKTLSLAPPEEAVLEQYWQELHAPLLRASELPVSLLALGDCLMNEIRVFLPALCAQQNIALDMRCIYFSNAQQRGLSLDDVKAFLSVNQVDLIGISFFSFSGIPAYSLVLREADQLDQDGLQSRVDMLLAQARDFIAELRKLTNVPVLLHNVSGLPLTRWRHHLPVLPPLSRGRKRLMALLNQGLGDLAEHTENCLLIDEWQAVNQYGWRPASKNLLPKALRTMAHTSAFGQMLSPQYLKPIRAFQHLKKTKALLLDFDNTLWRGVMADEEVEQFHGRQKLLRELKNAGLLLIAVSKNSEENIRWQEMTLQPEDFAATKINWQMKPQNIAEVAHELNLGLNSFVFIDDNPVERELVANELPDVVCLDAEADWVWQSLELLFEFPNTQQTEEASKRTEMYQQQVARKQSMGGQLDYPAMMASLGLTMRFSEALDKDLDRVSELVSRTNQFNTTTIRYDKSELAEMMTSPNFRIFVAELGDKFGELGIVCVAVIECKDNTWYIANFIMSCRAMGFNLELAMLHQVVKLAQAADVSAVTGRYVASDRNLPCAQLFANAGFEKSNDIDWQLEEASFDALQAVEWITQKPRS
ncbi:HAD-IIIC family phosphatase [Corallincola platygyrae]|uniref:HAD-IIIC family phosphatase n=1 Tax=Corallincola platygyrae TaxID=1193278 RepID=A0ABW4XLK5_9GAMM